MENHRNSLLMRLALLKSYTGGPSQMSPSYLLIEDRISPDVSKYGEIDREVYMLSGTGSLTKWYYYTPDADEKAETQYMYLIVNGQRFNIPTTSSNTVNTQYEELTTDTVHVAASVSDAEKQAIKERLIREHWQFCQREQNTQDNEQYCCAAADQSTCPAKQKKRGSDAETQCSDEELVKRFDLLRVGATTLPDNPEQLSWQWRCTSQAAVFKEIEEADGGFFPQYDINGDLQEETIYRMRERLGAATGGAADAPVLGYSVSFVSQGAGGNNPLCVETGLRNEMRIRTKNSNTYLTIDEMAPAAGNNRRKVKSKSGKEQVDLIERQYQLNRGADFTTQRLMGASGEVLSCATPGDKIACDAPPPSSDLCCNADNMSDKTCLDTNTNILYIRSVLRDQRQTWWSGQKQIR